MKQNRKCRHSEPEGELPRIQIFREALSDALGREVMPGAPYSEPMRHISEWLVYLIAAEVERQLLTDATGETIAQKVAQRLIAQALSGDNSAVAAWVLAQLSEGTILGRDATKTIQ